MFSEDGCAWVKVPIVSLFVIWHKSGVKLSTKHLTSQPQAMQSQCLTYTMPRTLAEPPYFLRSSTKSKMVCDYLKARGGGTEVS